MTLLLLTLAYVLIALLLLNMGLKSAWRWQVKLFVIILTSVFYVGTWYGLQHMQGWPVKQQLPAEFDLIAEYIRQPNKQTGSEGAIYLWVIDRAEGADKQPRAYRLPYRETLHENIAEARSRGRPQVGRRVEKASAAGDRRSAEPSASTIEFEDEPRTSLPAKR